ncbi:MAG TPA: DNA topoisomerase I [Candidatus Thermoplasmatota archaeon]|nr:DNA topoisomerase I [Candidatus Thermoplasmatota archaeon]
MKKEGSLLPSSLESLAMKVVVISEKDIAAKKIAAHLSEGDADQSKMGGVNVYEWKQGKGKAKEEWTVVGLRGHIITLDYPKEHTRWSLQKLPELVWVDPQRKVDKDAKPIAEAIKKLAKKADRVIVATDFDREGELIGVEALDLVKEVNPDVEIKRSRFSALTKDEVTRAFGALTNVDDKLAASAHARQVVDLAWGAALTRFLSIAAGQRGQDFLSVGRVQSPTLALIVDREKEIRAFQPVPFWEVTATVHKDQTSDAPGGARPRGSDAAAFDVNHETRQFWDERKATAAHAAASAAKTGRVASADKTKRTTQPPTPFDTTTYQRAAASLGYTIKRADSIAESLYTAGYISYPRTSNTVYPASIDLKEIVTAFAQPGSFLEKDAKKILAGGPLHPTRGKKETTDHPPIHPTGVVPKATELSGPEWKVYDLIARRFLATLSDPAEVERIKVTLEIGGETFHANGQTLLVPGFLAVYHFSSREDIILPALAVGDTVQVRGAHLAAKQTQPPSRLTQSKLVQMMEELNLGTKATRGDVIQKLYDRDFVRNKTPEPTESGFAMIDALEKYADIISKPEMTATLESDMDKIAEGDLKLDDVVTESREMLEKVVKTLEKNREKIGDEIRRALEAKNTLGMCAKTGHPLIIRRSRTGKRFVGCSGWPNCDVTFPLPQYGKIIPDKTDCPVCNAPVIQVVNQGSKRGPWVTCLTMGCKGVEEREAKARDERKAARAAKDLVEEVTGEAAEEAAPEVSDEDLGVVEES